MSNHTVNVIPVESGQQQRLFLSMARRCQHSDANWVEALRIERKSQWSKRQPFFEHAQAQGFIAWRGEEPVGVISAQLDALRAKDDGELIGWFGQLEAIDDLGVFESLVQAAALWLAEKGCQRMQGPYDLGVNQACGLLIEGHDTPPMVMMNHSPPYYAKHLETLGFAKAMDLYAYIVEPDFEAPASMQRLTRRLAPKLALRPLDFSRFEQEVSLLRDIFNDAWSNNWGFVPLTEAEFQAMGKELKQIIRPDYTCVAEVNGQSAGFIIGLPNINELIADLQGKLLPFGWARLLWRLKRNKATTARVPLMGVRKAFQRGPMGAAVSFSMIDKVRWALSNDGIRRVEMSWILETNQGMNSMIEAMGGDLYKRYRLYDRHLSDRRSESP